MTLVQRIGLVDHLGGLHDAIAAAAKLADLGPDAPADYLESEMTLREQLMMQLRSQALMFAVRIGLVPAAGPVLRILDPVISEAHEISRFNDPHGLYTYCWCRQPLSAVATTGLRMLTD